MGFDLEYPHIIASTKKAILMTHDVRYTTRYEGLPSSRSPVRLTSMRFEEGNPSREHVEQTLRTQLGIALSMTVEIVSIGPFTGYTKAA